MFGLEIFLPIFGSEYPWHAVFHGALQPQKPMAYLGRGKNGIGNESPGPPSCSHSSWPLAHLPYCVHVGVYVGMYACVHNYVLVGECVWVSWRTVVTGIIICWWCSTLHWCKCTLGVVSKCKEFSSWHCACANNCTYWIVYAVINVWMSHV